MAQAPNDCAVVASQEVGALDLVFSCAICNESLHRIYQSTKDDNTLRDGRESDSRVITRLWLTSCGHLVCGKHLDGGGAPFHQIDKPPLAVCPVCEKLQKDRRPKALFGIRGFHQDEHDKAIPRSFFSIPPISLDSEDAGMSALRFQFMSLIRTGTANTKRLYVEQQARADLSEQLATLQTERDGLRQAVAESQNQLDHVKDMEAKLALWEKRKPVITAYMTSLTEMCTEIDVLRRCVRSCGYDVPFRDYSPRLDDDLHMDTSLQLDSIMADLRPRDPIQVELDALRDSHAASSHNIREPRLHEDYRGGRVNNQGDREPIKSATRPQSMMPPPPLPSSRSPQRSNTVQQHESNLSSRLHETKRSRDSSSSETVHELNRQYVARTYQSQEIRASDEPTSLPILAETQPAYQHPYQNLGEQDIRGRDIQEYNPTSSHSRAQMYQSRQAVSTPSPQKQMQYQTAGALSVASPFFSRPRPIEERPRSPVRARAYRDKQSSRGVRGQHADANMHAIPRNALATLSPSHKSMNGLSFIDEPYSAISNRPLDTYSERLDMPSRGSIPTDQFRDDRGLFRRPDISDTRPPPQTPRRQSTQWGHGSRIRQSTQCGHGSRIAPLPSAQPSMRAALYTPSSRSHQSQHQARVPFTGVKRSHQDAWETRENSHLVPSQSGHREIWSSASKRRAFR